MSALMFAFILVQDAASITAIDYLDLNLIEGGTPRLRRSAWAWANALGGHFTLKPSLWSMKSSSKRVGLDYFLLESSLTFLASLLQLAW